MITAPTPTIGRSGYSRFIFHKPVPPHLLAEFLGLPGRRHRLPATSAESSLAEIRGEKPAWLHVHKLPAAGRALDGKIHPRLLAHRQRAVAWRDFHFDVGLGAGLRNVRNSADQINVQPDALCMRQKRYELLLETLAVLHVDKVEYGEHLLLVIVFQTLGELHQQPGGGTVIENLLLLWAGRRRRLGLLRRLVLGSKLWRSGERRDESQCQEDAIEERHSRFDHRHPSAPAAPFAIDD